MSTLTPLLTVPEVADALRVPVSTIRYWRTLGQGPKLIKVGRRLACRKDDLEAFIERLAKQEATA